MPCLPNQLWLEAEDVVGNVWVLGIYQITRQSTSAFEIYLPLVGKNFSNTGSNKLYLPVLMKQSSAAQFQLKVEPIIPLPEPVEPVAPKRQPTLVPFTSALEATPVPLP